MDNCKLSEKKCVPCTGTTPRLNDEQINEYLRQVPTWCYTVETAGVKIRKKFSFANYSMAMAFINKMAAIAEAENHHPDHRLYNYRYVDVDLTTHSIRGMSENDFILAAKIDTIKME